MVALQARRRVDIDAQDFFRLLGRDLLDVDVAVETLREFVRSDPMLRFFYPSMPWFKSLEGHPGYADVLAERQRRQERIRAELLSLEEQAAGTVLHLR